MAGDYNPLSKLLDNTPRICDKCSGSYEYNGAGEYICRNCGNVTYDDYGKVRKFIEEHGPAPYHVVKKATGVNGKLVREYLDTPNTEKKFNLKCRSCGCMISAGVLCSKCLAKQGAKPPITKNEPDETVKKSPKTEKRGGVHFVVDRKGR